jgi:hypothetical protein
MDQVTIRAARESWNDSTLLYFIDINGNKNSIVKNITVEEIQGNQVIEPTFRLNLYDAQKLFDDLYATGLRPSVERNETSAYRQAQEHINDLRGVVNKLFGLIENKPMFPKEREVIE